MDHEEVQEHPIVGDMVSPCRTPDCTSIAVVSFNPESLSVLNLLFLGRRRYEPWMTKRLSHQMQLRNAVLQAHRRNACDALIEVNKILRNEMHIFLWEPFGSEG